LISNTSPGRFRGEYTLLDPLTVVELYQIVFTFNLHDRHIRLEG